MPVGNWNEDDEDEDEDFCVLVLDLDFVDRPLDEVSGLSSFSASSKALSTAAIAAARAAVSVPPAAIAPTAAAAVPNAVASLDTHGKVTDFSGKEISADRIRDSLLLALSKGNDPMENPSTYAWLAVCMFYDLVNDFSIMTDLYGRSQYALAKVLGPR